MVQHCLNRCNDMVIALTEVIFHLNKSQISLYMCMFFNNSNKMQKQSFHILLGGKNHYTFKKVQKNCYKKCVTLFIIIYLQHIVSMQSIKRPCSHLLSFISNNYSKCLNNVEHSLLWFLIKKIYYRE